MTYGSDMKVGFWLKSTVWGLVNIVKIFGFVLKVLRKWVKVSRMYFNNSEKYMLSKVKHFWILGNKVSNKYTTIHLISTTGC